MEEIITSLGSIKIILLLLLLGWVLAGRVGKGLYFRCLVGWRREENKAFDIHPDPKRILNFFFFLPPFATKHSVSGRESDEREEVGWLFWDLWNTFKPCPITISPSIPILAVEETAEDGDDSERWAICVQRMRRIEESEERAHQQNILSLR